MSIRFRGGERLQRGRGIGGLLRLVKSVFTPIVKSIGRTAVKAVTSKAGKKALETIKDQVVSSAVNMTADVIKGNDLGESFQNEVSAARHTVGDVVKSFGNKRSNNKEKVIPHKLNNQELKKYGHKNKDIFG